MTWKARLAASLQADDDVLEELAQHAAATYAAAVGRILETLSRARVRASVLVLPGRALGVIDPVAAMEGFLEVAARHPEHDEVTLVEDADAQKAMMPIVEQARRRARAAAT